MLLLETRGGFCGSDSRCLPCEQNPLSSPQRPASELLSGHKQPRGCLWSPRGIFAWGSGGAAGWGGCPGQDSTEPCAFGCPACVWVLQSLCTSPGGQGGSPTQNLSRQAGAGYLPVSLVIHRDKIHEEHVVSHGVHAEYLHLEGGEHAPAAEQREGRAELSRAEGPQGAPRGHTRVLGPAAEAPRLGRGGQGHNSSLWIFPFFLLI